MSSTALPPPLPTLWTSPFPPEPPPAPELPPVRAAADLGHVASKELWAALDNQFRWKLILRMANGEELTAPQAMINSGLRPSTVRKHLNLLRMLGVADSRAGRDKRVEIFYLREARRPEPGVLDFGSCRIILATPPQPRPSSL